MNDINLFRSWFDGLTTNGPVKEFMTHYTSRLLKKCYSCFDSLSTNGKSSTILACDPFALIPSTPFVLSLSKERTVLRTGPSKPVVSLSNRVNAGCFSTLLERAKPVFSLAPRLLSFDLFSVKSQGLQKRPIAHRKEDRIFVTEIFMAVPTPRRHDKEVSPSPLEACFSSLRHPASLDRMVIANGGVPMGAALEARAQELHRA